MTTASGSSLDPDDPTVGDGSDEPPRSPRPGAAAVLVGAMVALAAVGAILVFGANGAPDPPDVPPPPTTPTTVPTDESVTVEPFVHVTVGSKLSIIDIAQTNRGFYVLAGRLDTATGDKGPSQGVVVSTDSTGVERWRVEVEGIPSHLAVDDASVWVAHHETGSVSRIDPVTGEVIGHVTPKLSNPFGPGTEGELFVPNGLETGFGVVWMSSYRGALARIATDMTVDVWQFEAAFGEDMAVGAGGGWLALGPEGLAGVDPESGAVTILTVDEIGHDADLVAAAEDVVVVASLEEDSSQVSAIVGGEVVASQHLASPVMVLRSSSALTGDQTLHRWVTEEPMVRWMTRVSTGFDAVEQGRVIFDDWGVIWLVEGHTAFPFEYTGEELSPIDLQINEWLWATEPADNVDWELVTQPPLSPRWPAIFEWDGNEVAIWGGEPIGGGSRLTDGAAFDPATGAWRMLDAIPEGLVSPDRQLTDWLATSGLSPNSRAAARIGDLVIGVDYELDTALFDPETGAWIPAKPVPLRFSECGIEVHAMGNFALVEFCGTLAAGDGEANWTLLTGPPSTLPGTVTVGDGTVWGYGSNGLFRLVADPSRAETIRSIPVAGLTVTLPEGWVAGPAQGTPDTISLPLDGPGGVCLLRATYGNPGVTAASILGDQAFFHPAVVDVGDSVLQALTFGEDTGVTRFLFAITTSDLIDIGCHDSNDALSLMRFITG